MKKAVIEAGGRQYLVSEGDEVGVNLLPTKENKITFEALMVVNGKDSVVGRPKAEGVKVSASIISADIKSDKVLAIRYKAKKRVKKIRGHRQRQTKIKIDTIK